MKNPQKGTFFINYRVDDSKDFARRLESALKEAFGEEAVFRDEGDINLTEDWKLSLKAALEQAEVLLAVIGPDWVNSFEKSSVNHQTQAITDWVRKEIEFALREGIDVIPILLPNTSLCSPNDAPVGFPTSLNPLLSRQGISIEKGAEQEGLDLIVQSLKRLLSLGGAVPGNKEKGKYLPPLAALPLSNLYQARLHALDEKDEPLIKSPYLGPIYFEEDHAAMFYGREWEIRALFHLVRRNALSLLDGYSGTGKSSLLHAGLLPRMRGLPHWQVWEPIRRNKQVGGLHKQVEAFLNNLPLSPSKKGLLILDQVEEMYTDPLPEDKQIEIREFGGLLDTLIRDHKNVHVLLVFRSEYVRKIINGLFYKYLPLHRPVEMHVGPLTQEGVKQAILGPKAWRQKYRLEIDPTTAELIAQDFVGDDFSPYGILLQIQLLHLWEEADREAQQKGYASPRVISTELYQDHQRGDLNAFIDKQLGTIASQYPWGDKIGKGLGLDVLYLFTTEEGTATSLSNKEFINRYSHLEGIEAEELLEAFKRVYLLSEAGVQEGVSRLAHDSIARMVRSKYLNSDACAQRAWRIVETKLREIQQGFERVSLSESDIASLEEGKSNMRLIPPEVERLRKRDAALYQEQRKTRFQYAYEGAERSIEHLEYEEALEQLQIAFHEGIHREKLRKLAWELPFPLMELGKMEGLQKSLAYLTQVGEQSEWMTTLVEKQGKDIEETREVLAREKPEWYMAMQAQYYPEMVQIQGDSFDMGSEEGFFDQETPVHQVTVSDFYLGATSVTFYQYGLYCLLEGKRLPADSGFGRGNRPVINVSWSEALYYCNWLSQRLGKELIYSEITETDAQVNWEGQGFRLPTEAEWEYAAREGGKPIRFGNGTNHANPEEINFNGEHSVKL